MKRSILILLFWVCSLLPVQAIVVNGGITGGQALSLGGQFIKLDPSTNFSVGNDTFQTPNLYAFNENQNIDITATISVNIGTNPQSGDTVASHYVFFDPAPLTTQTGFIDFDAPIYGVATATGNLAASDFLLNNAVTYLNPSLRGLEAGDSVSIDPGNNQRLLVNWRASTPGDYVRVFTQRSPGAVVTPPTTPMNPTTPDTHVVPLPASFAIYLLGLIGFGAIGISRRLCR